MADVLLGWKFWFVLVMFLYCPGFLNLNQITRLKPEGFCISPGIGVLFSCLVFFSHAVLSCFCQCLLQESP